VTPRLRIVFFGTPEFAIPSLRALLAGADEVVGVVCQPDRPAGRGQRLAVPPVKQLAQQSRVPLLQPDKLRAPEFQDALRAWAPDLIVVAAYGKILPKNILDLPAHGCINVHASLLPRYRGAAPIQWAIVRGETVTGVTIMQMSDRMDAGDILLQRETPIGDHETYGELQARLADLGARALTDALAQLHTGALTRRVQDESQVTLAPMIKKDDGRLDWTQPAAALARMVRAFNPWPSAFTTVGGKLLKIHRAHAVAAAPAAMPGTVTATGDGIAVSTGDGMLVLDDVQLEGRKRMGAAEFARGGGVKVGNVLGCPPAEGRV
jgi:methionyl-tRNA formyltransferase